MPRTVHIIGAGLAGLATAVQLAGRGVASIIHEASDRAGGRCRSYDDAATGMRIDNGTHILLSGNTAALAFLDTIGATAVLLLLSPLMLLTALLIKVDSHGPVLFFQTRNGFNGRSFRIVKFRSMHVLEDGNAFRQATRGDPRVTRLGRWLRRANIDELPQLFNVLKGNMSLVGPRPHPVALNNEYDKLIANYALRNHVKPGITGWAQVNGYRGETPTTDMMEQRVASDLWYISNWSMWLDIRILFRTLILGLQPTAY